MIEKNKIILCFIFSLALFSCRKDHPSAVKKDNIDITANGIYVINEGNFQFGNATVSYFDPDKNTASGDLFQPANNRPLGDVCQSLYFFNSKAYIVLNNSGKIEVVNAQTFVSSATIKGFTSPRYFLPVSNSKAYVTDLSSNAIAIVNLSTNAISGSIPCKGWTEELCIAYGKVFVTNKKSDKIYIINTIDDIIIDSIKVGYSPGYIREDKNGKLWVLCAGNPSKKNNASLHRINPATNAVEQTFSFPSIDDSPWRLKSNGSNDTLFYLNNGVYQFPISAAALPLTPLITQGQNNFYGLGIDPKNGTIYVSDALDFVQKGIVYRYMPNGTFINTFKAGIIPGDIYFK